MIIACRKKLFGINHFASRSERAQLLFMINIVRPTVIKILSPRVNFHNKCNYLLENRWHRWLGSLSPSLAVFVTFSILPGVVCITIRITIGNTISAADIPPATRTDAPCIAYEAAQFLQKQEHSCIAQVKYRRHWTTNSFSHFPGCQNAPGFLMLERMGRTMYRCHNGTLDFGTELLTKPYTIDKLAEKVRKVLDRK